MAHIQTKWATLRACTGIDSSIDFHGAFSDFWQRHTAVDIQSQSK